MSDPVTPAAATLAATGIAVPVLSAFGVSLGIRPDILLAGFCGAVAAMSLLNTVPGTGDTMKELVKTTFARVGVSIGSAVTAGYVTPSIADWMKMPESTALGLAFIVGAGAQTILKAAVQRVAKSTGDGK